MPSKPVWRDLALATLRENGPMSKQELIELLGPTKGARAGAAIATARHEQPGKFFRVVRYERQRGRAGREIPIYAAGGGKDAPRPDLSTLEARRERDSLYYRRNRARIIAKLHAKRNSRVETNHWLGLLSPEDRRATAASTRMMAMNEARRKSAT